MSTPKPTKPAKTLVLSPTPPASPGGKLGDLVFMLQGDVGATIAQMCEKTGWQPHSLRGALAGALKRRGYVITSLKTDGVRVYRAEAPEQ